MTVPRVKVSRSEAYGGARKARKIENFIYGLEPYFDALDIASDDARLRTILLYLKDSTLIW